MDPPILAIQSTYFGNSLFFRRTFVRKAKAPHKYAKDITTNVRMILENDSVLTIEKTMKGMINDTR